MTVIGSLTHDVFCMLCSLSHIKDFMQIQVLLFSLQKAPRGAGVFARGK